MDWWAVLQIIVGALITIGVVVFVESFRNPSLGLEIGDTEDATWIDCPANRGRWLRLRVKNRQLPWLARRLSRNTALHCSALITFYYLDGQNDGEDVFGRPMQARWWGVREPLPIQVVGQGLRLQIIDPVRLASENHRDIYSGQPEQLDVAVRFDDDAECYGWCDENYSCEPRWRNPKWKLDKGRYLVKVTVKSSTKCCDVFQLINDGSFNDFRLEKAQPRDRKKACKKT